MQHSHHHHAHNVNAPATTEPSAWKLAFSATVHCLVGCGIGEVVGVVIGTATGMNMWPTMALGIGLGFVFGLVFGIWPLVRAKFSAKQALRTVIVAEGLSIVVMEAFEVLTQLVIPGVMEAGLGDSIYWIGMGISLVVGFVAAFPVNLIMVKKGVRHRH